MPTYEYECLKCEYKFEEFQNMTDEPLKKSKGESKDEK
ncbi:MAG: zinc ribbon domain-containing protein [candidate division WOR-3 bacterium]